ncbi:MAG: hypothetical protein H7Z43_14725 [Clostridia bacterium]|nr:hypothetical protein [Deltaproteobacteria bacterium]
MATKGENLQSFKIADTRKPTVQGRKQSNQDDSGDSRSLGFARIERILENENHSTIKEKLTVLLDAVAEYEDGASAAKEKAAVKRAVIAIERAAELMAYLFQTKDELLEESRQGKAPK